VFNLSGDAVSIEEFMAKLEALRPQARELITAAGPQVPVAWRMDARDLLAKIPGLPKTALEEGMAKSLELFERLHAAGRI